MTAVHLIFTVDIWENKVVLGNRATSGLQQPVDPIEMLRLVADMLIWLGIDDVDVRCYYRELLEHK